MGGEELENRGGGRCRKGAFGCSLLGFVFIFKQSIFIRVLQPCAGYWATGGLQAVPNWLCVCVFYIFIINYFERFFFFRGVLYNAYLNKK